MVAFICACAGEGALPKKVEGGLVSDLTEIEKEMKNRGLKFQTG